MAVIKYKNPPQPPSGQGTFSDDLVGLQLVEGGGLTQGNFQFTQGVTEKSNRNFDIGNFSQPINLESLGIQSDFFDREIIARNFRVYPNFDLANVTNYSSYGSLTKRISTSVTKIINYFPASLDVRAIDLNFNSGVTVYDIFYDKINETTEFKVPIEKIRNPFGIDFTPNSDRNFELSEVPRSVLRNFNASYLNYSLFYKDLEYTIIEFTPNFDEFENYLRFVVLGTVFSGQSFTYDTINIRPNSSVTNVVFDENFDEVEKFLLNRLSNPIYTSTFDFPKESSDGSFYTIQEKATWPLDGDWNLDIRTGEFETYLSLLSDISKNMDEFKTNLVSRFLTTGAFKEFDTEDQKVEKILQIYGRSFDDIKKYIDGLANITSVNYNIGNDIPSALLVNLSQTLGWKTNISPISETDFLDSVFQTKSQSNFQGLSRTLTPTELNFQYFRNIILNSAYLFKSKGTRKSIEALLRLIGAPDALVEFNENIYLADGKISMDQFNENFINISGGTYVQESTV
jgi:hypothetical protein